MYPVKILKKDDFLKYSLPDEIVELTIPNLFIPVVNNSRIEDLTNYIQERKKKFGEKFGLDISLLKHEEILVTFSLKVNKNLFYLDEE